MDIFDAAMKYKSEGKQLIVVAGKDYGSGSSRDWAAKGPWILVGFLHVLFIRLAVCQVGYNNDCKIFLQSDRVSNLLKIHTCNCFIRSSCRRVKLNILTLAYTLTKLMLAGKGFKETYNLIFVALKTQHIRKQNVQIANGKI